jgi:large subunit ribosomal protein L23
MRDHRDVIKRPVITEQTTDLMVDRKYTFEVDVNANKTEIKDAIEAIFGVKVEKVNVMNYKGKFKRVGRYAGFKPRRRKAIVKLAVDSKDIEIFEA